MQTYTHLLIGGALGSILCPGNYLLQGAIITGSIAPDLVMVPSFALAKLRGEQPMVNQGPMTILLKEISHSLPLTFLIIGALLGLNVSGLFYGAIFAFTFGMMVHIIIDILTHGKSTPWDADQSCIWPFQKMTGKLGTHFGIWDYRYGPGILRPKPFEAGVCIACIWFWTYYVVR